MKVIFLLALLGFAFCAPFLTATETNDSWRKVTRAKPDFPMKLTIALKHPEAAKEKLEEFFWEVSNPESRHYGQYLTHEQLYKLMAPTEETVNTVSGFLLNNDVAFTVSESGDFIQAMMTAEKMEEVFGTTLHFYQHKNGQALVRASDDVHVPAHVAVHIDAISDLNTLPRLAKKPEASSNGKFGHGTWENKCGSECDGAVQPSTITERYSVPTTGPKNGAKMALAEFGNQYYDQSDMDNFTNSCGMKQINVAKLVGKNDGAMCKWSFFGACVESLLDIEYIWATAEGFPMQIYHEDQFSLLDWTVQISNDKDTAMVHSVSYGNDEAQQSSEDYMDRCNVEFKKAAALGISIIFASGDQGVYGREEQKDNVFHPDFPAGSPYITSVGGTEFKTDSIGEETATSWSGGGFSNHFAMPSFQKAAVDTYLNDPSANLPPQNMWNRAGRAYPDVAALSGSKNRYCVAHAGKWDGVSIFVDCFGGN
eukprot:TRINITY_DN17730_c0_g1_i1.p1 TRINITY_DN17730_c0_g1~~TRINITY_DN17730_c0_g1_i1.p1  ORF type:complete len:481 (+),score=116.96 TRINITY_DN17730_c0_g1_i1:52-1494(+)